MSVWDAKKPKRQSMLWGRSDLAEKFYSGQNAKLENDIMTQKVERQRLENKISNLESLVKTSVVRSTVSQQRTEKRLKAYKIIVDKLARAASRRELR